MYDEKRKLEEYLKEYSEKSGTEYYDQVNELCMHFEEQKEKRDIESAEEYFLLWGFEKIESKD